MSLSQPVHDGREGGKMARSSPAPALLSPTETALQPGGRSGRSAREERGREVLGRHPPPPGAPAPRPPPRG